ncbi:MAG: NADPH2:quinone reductase [Gammaproteobacteria bacterium]|jgi:NADPH2:quinone reductase
MRAIVCRDFAQPLLVENVPDPAPQRGEILIEAAACGVTFVDGLIVSGRYQIKPQLPHVPGFEIAGTVREVAGDASKFQVGDRVFATTGLTGGGYAELATVPEDQAFALPASMTYGQGATFLQSYCTAWFSLVNRMTLKPGQTLLVLGASGGVGRAAVDVGKALGANVIAGASSDERLESLSELHPDATINYSRENLKDRARELSEGGVDAVFDPVGGDLSEPALRALGHDGTFLVVGFALGTIPQLPANQILLRNRRVVGVEWGGWRVLYPDSQAEMVNDMLSLLSEGKLAPAQPQSYPLSDVAAALEAVNGRQIIGKVALIP